MPRRAVWWVVTATMLSGLMACSSPSSSTDPAPSSGATERVTAVTPRPDKPRPTVVLVHGAWADASSWNGVTESLLEDGYDVRAIANPVEDLTTDAEYVADFLTSLTGPVVLVGHSYGGSVITNAAAGNPQVKALVYIDAAAPDVGETNGSLSGADSVLNRRARRIELFDELPEPGAPSVSPTSTCDGMSSSRTSPTIFPRTWPTRLWASQRTASTERVRHAVRARSMEDHPVVVLHQHR